MTTSKPSVSEQRASSIAADLKEFMSDPVPLARRPPGEESAESIPAAPGPEKSPEDKSYKPPYLSEAVLRALDQGVDSSTKKVKRPDQINLTLEQNMLDWLSDVARELGRMKNKNFSRQDVLKALVRQGMDKGGV